MKNLGEKISEFLNDVVSGKQEAYWFRPGAKKGPTFIIWEEVTKEIEEMVAGACEVIVEQATEIVRLKKENTFLKDSYQRRKEWLFKAKRDAGYPDNISFDVVWQDALRALRRSREASLEPDVTSELLKAAEKALAIADSWIHDQLDGTSGLESALEELEPIQATIAKIKGE